MGRVLARGGASPAPRWTREQIRAARLAPLVPLLQKRGLELVEPPAGNFELAAYPGVLVKDSHWRRPERNLAANAIDFHVQAFRSSPCLSMFPMTPCVKSPASLPYDDSQAVPVKNTKNPTLRQQRGQHLRKTTNRARTTYDASSSTPGVFYPRKPLRYQHGHNTRNQSEWPD
jgi:hypothetical protein